MMNETMQTNDRIDIELAPFQVEEYYHNDVKGTKKAKLILNEGAKLKYFLYHIKGELKMDYEIDLKKDAELTFYTVSLSSDAVNLKPIINLNATGSAVKVISLFLSTKEGRVNCDCTVNHNRSHTFSKINNYMIALDEAKIGIINNTVIKKGSIKSDASQMAKGLNIGEHSNIKADPNLLIEEFDVIAHHGAAIGSMNKDELFYLMSRGLSEKEASKIIVYGFLHPVLEGIKDENIKNTIQKDFQAKIK